MNNIINPFAVPDLTQKIQEIDSVFDTLAKNPNYKDLENELMQKRTDFSHIGVLVEYLIQFNQNSPLNHALQVAIELKNIIHIHYSTMTNHGSEQVNSFVLYLRYNILQFYLTGFPNQKSLNKIMFEAVFIMIEKDFPENWD